MSVHWFVSWIPAAGKLRNGFLQNFDGIWVSAPEQTQFTSGGGRIQTFFNTARHDVVLHFHIYLISQGENLDKKNQVQFQSDPITRLPAYHTTHPKTKEHFIFIFLFWMSAHLTHLLSWLAIHCSHQYTCQEQTLVLFFFTSTCDFLFTWIFSDIF